MARTKIDLHSHGMIGFHQPWLGLQLHREENLLQNYADACFRKYLDVSAVTSESDQVDSQGVILRNTPHSRLEFLSKQINNLPKNYHAEIMGDNIIVVQKGKQITYLVAGQTVIVKDNGVRYDHLVFGSDKVPNFMNFKDTVQFCNDHGLVHGLEHMFAESHFGLGKDLAESIVDKVDFVEGHNQQLTIPAQLANFPILGKFNRSYNKHAKEFAKAHNKPYIATSDSHRFGSIGHSYTIFPESQIDLSKPYSIQTSVKRILADQPKVNNMDMKNRIVTVENYENPIMWGAWVGAFTAGIIGDKIYSKFRK